MKKNYKVTVWRWNEEDYIKHCKSVWEDDPESEEFGYYKGYKIIRTYRYAETPEEACKILVADLLNMRGARYIVPVDSEGVENHWLGYIRENGNAWHSVSVEYEPRHHYGYDIETLME